MHHDCPPNCTTPTRSFRIVYPDGRTLHGAQFPNGHVIVADNEHGLWDAATAIEHLASRAADLRGRVEWTTRARRARDDHN